MTGTREQDAGCLVVTRRGRSRPPGFCTYVRHSARIGITETGASLVTSGHAANAGYRETIAGKPTHYAPDDSYWIHLRDPLQGTKAETLKAKVLDIANSACPAQSKQVLSVRFDSHDGVNHVPVSDLIMGITGTQSTAGISLTFAALRRATIPTSKWAPGSLDDPKPPQANLGYRRRDLKQACARRA